ncbi:MAG: TatD family hydrolase [Bacilli bacterium]
MLVDTHCHILKQYYSDINATIKRMKEKQIIGFISGTDIKTNEEVIELAKKNKNLYATVGFYPLEADKITDQDWINLEKMIQSPFVIAMGEIGLDYYRSKDNVVKQKEVFIKQIRLAKKYGKPIIIHNRDAMDDVFNILKKEDVSSIGGIMHCYSGDLVMAKKFIELNLLIAVGGILTFNNAKELRNVIKNIDMEYIVLETDSPYLAPVPFRGKQNEPTFISYIVDSLAELKGIDSKEIEKITTNNVCSRFNIK